MAAPFEIWPGLTPGVPAGPAMPMMPGMGVQWGIPAIPPSSHPLIVNPEGAVRDFTEHVLSGDRKNMCTERDQSIIADWVKNDDYKKIIGEVIKARIELPWPYNYKVLDLLGVLPTDMVVALGDKIKGLAEAPSSMEGSALLQKLGKPLNDKVAAEKAKAEEEEAKKKQEAIMNMWGGLWANDGFKAPAGMTQAGWGGWQYPYQFVGAPGVAAQAPVAWNSKAPEGWAPSKITPMPQLYPFSRVGYYAMLPEDQKPPDPPKAGTYTISVIPGVKGAAGGITKTIPLGMDQLQELWKAQLAQRGW